jgi:hypothetical protein
MMIMMVMIEQTRTTFGREACGIRNNSPRPDPVSTGGADLPPVFSVRD